MHQYHVLTDQGKYSNSFAMSIQYYFVWPRKNVAELNKNIL